MSVFPSRLASVLIAGSLASCATVPAPHGRPPQLFVSDGCTLFPDGDYEACCAVHDRAYWCGGTRAERRLADHRLARCIAERGHPTLARLIEAGVRIGGMPWLPTPWRWGFGWPYPLGYTDIPIAACVGMHDDHAPADRGR